MSPLKIAIATFVVGLIGLTASAMERSRSTGEHGSSAGSQPAMKNPGSSRPRRRSQKKDQTKIILGHSSSYDYEFKPITPGLTMEDVYNHIDAEKIPRYKRYLTFVHMYEKRRQKFNLKGTLRQRTMPTLEDCLVDVGIVELEVLEDMLGKGEERAIAIARAQAEQLDGAQAEQLDGAEAELARARVGARARIERARAQAKQLDDAHAEQLDDAQAEQLDSARAEQIYVELAEQLVGAQAEQLEDPRLQRARLQEARARAQAEQLEDERLQRAKTRARERKKRSRAGASTSGATR